ncbi:dTDP-4-dehydrorhamnose reductase [Candidatus Uhrbacteria bacterium CG_4_9_14_3_um_filter_36_7]|uniref:dTDP-4-dehydrorhamnose reductase n=1 Tax=Candidatus Uhrbacteria bacterium CG_4_9_14_3_um_filter_36_7 TaxID=1975033 RepID=A0A2M7XET5_9BACT|nr:MAG: dTDP-4-dehydrorhamnose reductase [Candidatus Uhrbacteria bacterium CG_4_9_14_3_um_filter_36_7]
MKILLFGGQGRLGTAIQNKLTQHQYVYPTSQEVNITDKEAVTNYIQKQPVNIIINLAAYNNVDAAEKDSTLADAINTQAPGYIAEATTEKNIPFVHFSTDYVFEGTKKEGYVESDQPNPINAYGKSKWLGEKKVLEKNLQAFIIRTSRLYGPPAKSPNAKRSFVDIVLDLASKESSFTINESEVSAPTLVDDIALHLQKYFLDSLPEPGIYHMSNQGGCTWFEWAKEIVDILNLPVQILPRDQNQQPRPAKRPLFSILHSTKITPMRPWQEALKNYLLHP